jgi:hypothetical protein
VTPAFAIAVNLFLIPNYANTLLHKTNPGLQNIAILLIFLAGSCGNTMPLNEVKKIG